VPCHDEAERLRLECFRACLANDSRVEFLCVDDGSTDGTLELLRRLESEFAPRVRVLALERNLGKAGAVRAGVLQALEREVDLVGFFDADLATPLDELPRFYEVFEAHPRVHMVFGARVKLLGRAIERNPVRHYLGRIFATLVSNALELSIYDSQCGAKLFRADELTHRLFEEPFQVGWIFDVEILARLVREHRRQRAGAPEELIYELPLNAWGDIPGSKVGWSDFPRAIVELLRIHRSYLRR